MARLMISSSQMCISREQEEFLAAYRTDEARQAFIDSYGKEKVNFFDGGYGENSNKPFVPEPPLPYDYEVEYLEVTADSGIAYIDTAYVPTGLGISLRASFLVNRFVGSSFSSVFSAYRTNNEEFYRFLQSGDSSLTVIFSYAGSTYKIVNITLGELLTFEFTEGGGYVFNDISGTLSDFKILPNVSPMLLFGNTMNNLFYGRFYSFFIADYDEPKVDMIPVSKDGVGYMYDRVSGELFAAQGGGSFVVGPRKI